MALVDIILPVHDGRPEWLVDAVRSVRDQTLEDWRLHVVDDACPRGSVAVIEAVWPKDDDRLRILRLPSRRGQVAARTEAIRTATAPWLALIDQDDVYAPDKLARQLEAAEGRAEVVYVDVTYVDADGTELVGRTREGVATHAEDQLAGLDRRRLVEALFVGNVLDFPSTLFARSSWEAAGGFETRFPGGEDWGFWIAMAAADARFAHVADRLYRKRVHPASDGARTLDERNLGYFDLAVALRRRLGIDGPGPEERERALRRRAARSAIRLQHGSRAVRLLGSMAVHGQSREAVEVLADTLTPLTRVREARRRRRG